MAILDRLYEEGEVWLEDRYYRDIVNHEEFYTKLAGVTFEARQDIIRQISEGEAVSLIREPDNLHDSWAVAVYFKKCRIGYLNSRLARHLAPMLDKGERFEAYVTQVTGRDKNTCGVNVRIRKIIPETDEEEFRKVRLRFQHLPSQELEEEVKKAILGKGEYREKQKEALALLKEGINSLLIFATGRGKSAVFQTMACFLALQEKKMTVVVYPLRSLVNDQYQSLREKVGGLGLSVAAVNGSVNSAQKQGFFVKLRQGSVDIVLTTPEFLEYHIDKFRTVASQIGLFVVDEAHHLAEAKRKGYRHLPQNWRKLGKPLALAATATAGNEAAARIIAALECKRVVIERHERRNLSLADFREIPDKLQYLLELIAKEEKTVIYVNSRKQAYQLACDLRLYYPAAKNMIAFYHGGLSNEDRLALETMFREGNLRVMVTTSAFGEGIDIPDIRNVVLYHLCFSRTEFNQLSGRAGRDNEKAGVHILFGRKDCRLNELILEGTSPSRATLGRIYLFLKKQAQEANPVEMTNHQICEAIRKKDAVYLREQTVSSALTVLEELNLIKREVEGSRRYIRLVPPPPEKLELRDSLRYLEGQQEWDAFQEFAQYALNVKGCKLLEAVNGPIYPLACNPANLRE